MSERVLVCGDRNWANRTVTFNTLTRIHEKYGIDVLIHGACRGADMKAEVWAKAFEVPYYGFPARFKTGEAGPGEGPIRNQRMLDEARPTMVVAFHDDLAASKGTADMVRRAKEAGVPVYHFTSDGKGRRV